MKIILLPHAAEWSIKFDAECTSLHKQLPAGTLIEHIGSTAVEGLGAKPIIDIMIGIPDFSNVTKIIPILVDTGYSYVSEFESSMPERRFFTKDEHGKRTVHIHMVEAHTAFWKRHLFFRDHLRNNEKDREAYFRLKFELSQREWDSGSDYANAKTEFIEKILNQNIG